MQPTRLNWIETQQDLSAQREELRRQLVVADTWQRAWMQKSLEIQAKLKVVDEQVGETVAFLKAASRIMWQQEGPRK